MRRKGVLGKLSIVLLLLVPLAAGAQVENSDSVGYGSLDSTLFVSHKVTSPVVMGKDSKMVLDMDLISSLPKFLGNTDPINVLKFMPGVQTVSEFDSGINIQGCDDSHNEISLDGVPIYGAAHLFGFFSVFNPSHFSKFDFQKTSFDVIGPNRIGASIDMRNRKFEDSKITGEVNAGIMSSQGTLSWRISPKTQLHVSARQSYMNLLYKRWMKFMDYPIRYGFGDYNLTFLYRPTDADELKVDAYFGMDKMSARDDKYNLLSIDLKWGNYAAAIHWKHDFRNSTLKQKFYTTSYTLHGHLVQDINDLLLPSHITTYAYDADWKGGNFYAGGNISWHDAAPQAPVRLHDDDVKPYQPEHQSGLEADLYLGYKREFGSGLGFSAGGKGLYYLDPERKSHGAFSPAASFWYDSYSYGRITASYAWQHQYLFKTGIPNVGLPLDFWFLAGRHSAPQSSHSVSLAYNCTFLDGMLALDATAYFKSLSNQVEYGGSFLDFFTTSYDLDKFLHKGRGMNYGFNVMLHKTAGKFTGWVSYSLGRSLRNFAEEDYRKWYPSNHERIHELNIVANYKVKRWDLSASFVCASGLPFTPPNDFYITSGHLVTSYGEYNSRRVEPYVRLDLSVNFTILKDDRNDFGINFSMFNVLGNRNPIGYQLRMTNRTYYYGPIGFSLKFIPSLSLYYKF